MARFLSTSSVGFLLATLAAATGNAVAQYVPYQPPQYAPPQQYAPPRQYPPPQQYAPLQPYQVGPVTVQPGGFNYASNGTQFGGVNQGQTTGGYYTDGQGNSGNGYVRYGNNAALGGAYRTNNGTNAAGYVGGDSGQVQYQSPGNGSAGGQYQAANGNVAVSGYQYDPNGNGYNGGFATRGGVVQAQGEVRRPGYIPGTQDRIGGDATYAGRDSAATGHYQVYDAGGQYRIAGMDAGLDRRQYTQAANLGVGPAQAGYGGALTFQGMNSRVGYDQNVGLAGFGGYNYGVQAGNGNLGGNARLGVGGYNVGANAGVNQNGFYGQMAAPRVGMPPVGPMPHLNAPHVNAMPHIPPPHINAPISTPHVSAMPHISTPHIDPPHISAPTPHLSVPTSSGISMPKVHSPF